VKPLTMTDERLAAIRFVLGREPEHVQKNAKGLLAEVDALRAALAAAEAKLADERKHADALKEGLAACVGERATFYAGQSQTVTWAVAIEHAESLLSTHAARRNAHDEQCESEFDSQVHAHTPCGCAARRNAEKETTNDQP
jgi:hypothetical protein